MNATKEKPIGFGAIKRGESALPGKSNDGSRPMTDSTRLSTALRYASAGLPVVPLHGTKDGRCTCGNEDCARPGEHPRTEHGLDDATTDPVKVGELWTKSPKAKIGIATGAPDIIALVVHVGVEDEWQKFLPTSGLSLNTVEFYCEGSHFYLLRAPPSKIPKGEITVVEDRLSVLGKDGYIAMPSSLDTSVGRSRFALGHAIGDVDFQAAPDCLLKLLRPPETGIELPVTTSVGSNFNIQRLEADWIEVPDDPPCNHDQVKLFAEGFRMTGVRSPLTVRPIKLDQARRGPRMHRFALLSDPHLLAAIKSLGFTLVECIVMDINERDGRLLQIAELLHRPDLDVVDWAELVMEWVQLVREKGGHDAHPHGGQQPHDRGLSNAERVLGISRRDLRRAEQICGICDEAKKEIRNVKLKARKAILKVASEPVENQVAKVHELAGAPTVRVQQAPETEPTPEPKTDSPDEAPKEEPAEKEDGKQSEDDADNSPPLVPADGADRTRQGFELPDIPPFPDRRAAIPGGDSEEAALRALEAAWYPSEANKLFVRASDAIKERFIAEVLGYRVAGKVGKTSG
jgi:ParB-like chromosome segregation protein Spo0J